VDKKLLMSVRDTIRQGFSWATREGPLCEERKSAELSLCFQSSFLLVGEPFVATRFLIGHLI